MTLTQTRTSGASSNWFINALSYGVKADNSTDDSAALQAALNAATVAVPALSDPFALPRRIVQLPPGRIVVQSTVRVPANTMLRGHGIAGTYLVRNGGGSGAILGVQNGSTEQTLCDFGIICQDNAIDCIDLVGTNSQPSILADGHVLIRDVVIVGGNVGIKAYEGTEHRFSRVACYRQYTHGFDVRATDCFFEGCTVAAAGQVNVGGTTIPAYGFTVAGANSRLYGCKAFGQHGTSGAGFGISGAGRHEVSCCEAQDCEGNGFNVAGSLPTVLSACLADSCGAAGFEPSGGNVLNACSAVNRGGAYTMHRALQPTLLGGVGVIVKGFRTYAVARVNNAVPPADPHSLDIDNRYGSQTVAYAATVTPDPWLGQDVAVGTLTGNITIANPTSLQDFPPATDYYPKGMRLNFLLTQDGTGGRTVTFGANYKTTAAIDTTLSTTTLIGFLWDGTNWRETTRVKTT